jgi:hypothetical protein
MAFTLTPERRFSLWIGAFVVVAVAAAALPPLAVPGTVITLLLFLSFPDTPTSGRIKLAVTALAAVGVLVGLFRFGKNAMQGMVEGGQSVAAKSALYRLREIVRQEDAARITGLWDPDGDHIGSAVLLGGLSGQEPLATGKRLDPPLLNYAYRDLVLTPIGPATRIEGYLAVVCLPETDGTLTARLEDPIDPELAERRFVAYAWPSEIAQGMTTAFFVDEHENIKVLDLPRGATMPYLGIGHPPACDAALGKDGQPWETWQHKKPRASLPGDKAP